MSLDAWLPERADGWPEWLWVVPYVGTAHPQAVDAPLAEGANCQRFAYAVLRHFGRGVPSHRSSELWSDRSFAHPPTPDGLEPLDLVLFNRSDDPFGAHVAVWIAEGRLLHLCAEVGKPAVWDFAEFAARPQYRHVVGAVRVPPTAA